MKKRFLSNPAPGENILSGNLVMETGCMNTYVLSSSRKPSGRFLMVSVVDIVPRFLMVSVVGIFMVPVVAKNVFNSFRRLLFNGSRRGGKAGKHFFLLLLLFWQEQARAEPRKGWDATDSPHSHDCAGHRQARHRHAIMASPRAAQRPRILT